MKEIDEQTILLVDAMEKISRAMADPHRWSLKEQRDMRTALDFLMKVTGELDYVEIGPEPFDTWKKVTL